MNMLFAVCLSAFIGALIHAAVVNAWSDAIEDKAPDREKGSRSDAGISVIVPMRDAEETIVATLQDLHAQHTSASEVIVVDDHSSDRSARSVREMMRTWPNLRLEQLGATKGKKAAISRGVELCTGAYVLISDADVRSGRGRLSRILEHLDDHPSDLVLMPIRVLGGAGLLGWIQRKEQAALMGAAMGSGLAGTPVLANGANMAFRRAAFAQVNGFSGDNWASGDDMFLLQRMRKAGARISYLADPDAIVDVAPENTWHGWWSQRLRWAGKMRAYRDRNGMVAGLAAILFPWLLVAATFLFVREARMGQGMLFSLSLIGGAWMLWLMPVLRLVRRVEIHWGSAKGTGATLPALFAFVCYAPVIAIVSIFVRPTWKGRRV